MRKLAELIVAFLVVSGTAGRAAPAPSLALTRAGVTHRFTSSELLARRDVAEVSIPTMSPIHTPPGIGPSRSCRSFWNCRRTRRPTRSNARQGRLRGADPARPGEQGDHGRAGAWVAVEPPASPGRRCRARRRARDRSISYGSTRNVPRVSTEQWPYPLASLTAVESPAHRWPQLAVDPALPANAPARRGEAVFAANCLSCHRLNGGGAGEIGPDLGTPMNATDYLRPEGLRAIVRNPRAVRTWPQQQMPGFSADALSDADLDALIAYLHPGQASFTRVRRKQASESRHSEPARGVALSDMIRARAWRAQAFPGMATPRRYRARSARIHRRSVALCATWRRGVATPGEMALSH